MYRLRTFGGLSLEADGEPLDPVGAHRKGLALLAVLAAQGTAPRDSLMALLWPESSTPRARGSLKQTVHLLRRDLGEPGLLLGTAELRLNPEVIQSDVQLFLDALRGGDPEGAAGHYAGPFLDGVHLEGAPEFQRWTEAQRDDLARRFAGALEGLARDADRKEDHAGAARWWRSLQAADPLSSRIALELMKALERSGDPGAALRHARVHELVLREELGIPPDDAVRELVQRLGAGRGEGGEVDPLPVPPPPAPAGVAAGPTPPLDTRARRGLQAPVFLALLAVALVLLWWRPSGDGPSEIPPQPATAPALPPQGGSISLAVLPFVDMSPEGNREYFVDGVTEELLHALARVPGLQVPARTSSFRFKGRNLPAREIAAELGVDHLLEGSVRSSGDQVRITAQLIDARTDRHLWSETFDGDLRDLFALQSGIARSVAEALEIRLFPGDAGVPVSPPLNPAAHDLYLRGLFHWNRRSAPDLQLALRFFHEAVELAPDFARAHAGLALAYAVIPIGFVPILPQEEAWTAAEGAAARALALDSTRWEPHAALGLSHHFRWRWADAEREYRRALELDPRSAIARQWYGEHLAKTGRAEEGVEELRTALELDPLSLVIQNDLGLALMLGRRFPEAEEQFRKTVAMDPGFAIPLYLVHRLQLVEGRLAEAEEYGRRWAELTGVVDPAHVVTIVRGVAAGGGGRREAAAVLRGWETGPSPRWLDIAYYWIALGEPEAALDALERGLEARAPMMVQVGSFPGFDPLRGDPRMDRIAREVGFP